MSMFKFWLLKSFFHRGLLLVAAVTLWGCGGGGGGGDDTARGNNGPDNLPSELCSSSVTIQGYLLITSVHDTDNDGCLSEQEVDAAINAIEEAERIALEEARELAEAAALRTVEADISDSATFEVGFQSASVIGNSEAIDGRAQIHTNMLNGKFQINFSIFPSLDDDEELVIAFSNGTAAQVLGGVEGIEISESGIIVTEASIFSTTIECTYSNGFNFDCEIGGVAIDTINISPLFDTVPVEANLVILACLKLVGCYANHATIPITLL